MNCKASFIKMAWSVIQFIMNTIDTSNNDTTSFGSTVRGGLVTQSPDDESLVFVREILRDRERARQRRVKETADEREARLVRL